MEVNDFLLKLPNNGSFGIIPSIFLFIFFFWASLRFYKYTIKKKKTVPEAPGAWPIIGHLHLLGGSKPVHRTLTDMANKHGPLFSLRLGVHKTLIVSNWEIAKEFFTTHDKAFANRPWSLAVEIMGYNSAMFGFSPYGPYWREIRKITTLEVLSNARLETLKHVRESEVLAAIKKSYENKAVEMTRWFGDITLNVVMRMIVGKRYEEEDEKSGEEKWRNALRDFFELTGRFVVADAVPYLRWLDVGGHEKAMRKAAKEMDYELGQWLEEHRQKKALKKTNKDEQDFMDVMVSILDDAEELPSYDSDTIIKATCLAIILGGTDTMNVTMTWGLSLLLNNPQTIQKAQHELDTFIGPERHVQESDIKNLTYLQAIIKETLRLYPAAPLSVPHESSEDSVVAGYYIPAGTRLITNLSKLQRDPNVWSNPDEFRPERFLEERRDMDVRGQNFEYVPFGTGRRICPGISFALQVMQLTFANLLHAYDVTTPNGEKVDMTEAVGLTNIKAHPLDVLLVPRLPAYMYKRKYENLS